MPVARSLRRRALRLGVGLTGVAAPRRLHAQQRVLYINSQGGSWEASAKKNLFEPFAARTGIEIQTAPGASFAKLAMQACTGVYEYDIATINTRNVVQAMMVDLPQPIDVYSRPVSRFAASFIGGSNILDGRIGANQTELVIDNGTRLQASQPLPAGRSGEACLLLRPEDIQVDEPPVGSGVNRLTLQVTGVLNMGAGILMLAQHGWREIRVRSATSVLASASEGATLPMWWTPGASWPIPQAAIHRQAINHPRSRR